MPKLTLTSKYFRELKKLSGQDSWGRQKVKRLRNGDYFTIITFCSQSVLLKNYASGGPVEASLKKYR